MDIITHSCEKIYTALTIIRFIVEDKKYMIGKHDYDDIEKNIDQIQQHIDVVEVHAKKLKKIQEG